MKRNILSLVLVFISTVAYCGKDYSADFRKAAELERTKGAIHGLKIYKHIIDENPQNLEALQKGCLAAARCTRTRKTEEMQRNFAALTLKYAIMADKVAPNNAQNKFLLALSKGLLALSSSVKEKAKLANQIESDAKRAIALDPSHPYAHHILGKLYYELSNVSDFERKVAKGFIGNLPAGSIPKAIAEMEKNYQINPSYVVNLSDLGLAYHKDGDDEKARFYLNKALEQKPVYYEDKLVFDEVRALLKVLDQDS